MTKKTFTGLVILFILIIIYFLGPKLNIYSIDNEEFSYNYNFDDLYDYLEKTEYSLQNIVDGTEKKFFIHENITNNDTDKFFYNGKKYNKSKYSIVYVHGFSSSRQEISPTFEKVSKDLGFNIFFTRLKGHGDKNIDNFKNATIEDWVKDIYEAIEIGKKIGKEVIIAGCSTAAPIITYLYNYFPDKISGLILISPNYSPAGVGPKLIRYPWGKYLPEIFIGKYRTWKPKNNLQKKYWHTHYPSVSLIPMIEATMLADETKFSEIDIPLLMLYTENDKVIDLNVMIKVYRKIPKKNKTLYNLKESKNHILAGDAFSPETTNKAISIIKGFIKKISRG